MVHGINQENKDPEELKQTWIKALKLGFEKAKLDFPEGLTFDFPYYGDLLLKLQSNYEAANKGAEYNLKSTSPDTDTVLSLQEKILEEMLKDTDFTNLELEPEQPAIKEKAIYNHMPFLALARALDGKRYLGNLSLVIFTSVVAAYLSVNLIRHKVDQKVHSHIFDDTDVVIAHSLGSVVAYNVLNAGKKGPVNLKLFVTLGSPLGLMRVKAQLETPVKFPPCLSGKWINLYDPKDMVSLYPLDAENFNVNPEIDNFKMENNSNNHHDISEYLSDPLVASYINKLYVDRKKS
ncbi:hypothetical protein OC25_03670 [Pedobacter kyungheensis]|nr:hypothetical protein OC25_03670 [Pedobacter kyungheensis]